MSKPQTAALIRALAAAQEGLDAFAEDHGVGASVGIHRVEPLILLAATSAERVKDIHFTHTAREPERTYYVGYVGPVPIFSTPTERIPEIDQAAEAAR